MFKLSGKLEISSYFDQLSANIGKGWSTSSATSVANVLKRKSTLQYTKLELMTNDLSHEKCGEASFGKSTYNNHMRKHTNAVAKPKAP